MVLDSFQIHLDADGKVEKVFVAEGCFVFGLDLAGTTFRLASFCSKPVRDKFFQVVGDDVMDLGAKLLAKLFFDHYYPTSEWTMDDDEDLWDAAVLQLLEQVQQ